MPRAESGLDFRRMGSLSDKPLAVVRRPEVVEILLHDSCWRICLVVLRCRSLFYTPRDDICLVVKRITSFSYTNSVGICLVVRRMGNLSYTPRASMCLV